MKEWQVKEKVSEEIKNQFPNIHYIILQLLYNRNIKTQEEIDEFLLPDYLTDIHSPFLFKDMAPAVERILKAIEKGEKITVHGDYDVDGVTSSATLVSALEKLGAKDVEIYIPHRESEGYGLNKGGIDHILENKTNLIITVDCGIRDKEIIDYIKSKNVDVIVTDHHEPPEELPNCLIINPKTDNSGYPFRPLAGVGVAFKLAQALFEEKVKKNPELEKDLEGSLKWLLDMVAIGTIADCMPILGENRTIVKYGLVVLNKTQRIGLKKLLEKAGLEDNKILDTYNIGFQIAPRLNAAGRMAHANKAFNLLMAKDEKEAQNLAEELDKNNIDRQELTARIIKEVEAQIKPARNTSQSDVGGDKDKKIIIALASEDEDWPLGVVGLVAGRISDRYHRPVLVIRKGKDLLEGSGRSTPNFNLVEALKKIDHLFDRYGGHAQACGFSLKKENFEEFKEKMEQFASEQLTDKDLLPILDIDLEIKLEDVTWEVFDILEKFKPFGNPNTRPLFLIKDLIITESTAVGKDKTHLKLSVSDKNKKHLKKCIGFCLGDKEKNGGVNWCEVLNPGDMIDVVCEIDVNQWNGTRELQLKIVDLKKP